MALNGVREARRRWISWFEVEFVVHIAKSARTQCDASEAS